MCACESVKHMCVCVGGGGGGVPPNLERVCACELVKYTYMCVCGRGREGVEYLPIWRECVYANQ